ncbi:MAG: hypothetical protein QM767_09965 [Anaeromyxobacter sp.]
MAGSRDHLEALTDAEYHKDGACVVRHQGARNPECKYEQNGYTVTSTARAAWYNAPARFDLAQVDWVQYTPRDRKVANKVVKSFVTPEQGKPVDPTTPTCTTGTT